HTCFFVLCERSFVLGFWYAGYGDVQCSQGVEHPEFKAHDLLWRGRKRKNAFAVFEFKGCSWCRSEQCSTQKRERGGNFHVSPMKIQVIGNRNESHYMYFCAYVVDLFRTGHSGEMGLICADAVCPDLFTK